MKLFSFQNIAWVHPPRTSEQQIFSSGIFGLVLRPSLVGFKLEPCMAVTHVLFVDDESRGDSIFQFACFARVGNHAKRVNVRCALWMMRAVFSLSDLGPSRLCVRRMSVSCLQQAVM